MKKLLFLLCFLFVTPVQAQWEPAEVDIVFNKSIASAGDTLKIGFLIKLEDGWHTYWKNPGHAGLPLTFTVKHPDVLKLGEIQYPTPERIEAGPLVTFGYHGQVLFVRDLVIPKNTNLPEIKLNIDMQYLVCEDQCLVKKKSFEKTVLMASDSKASVHNDLFETTATTLPNKGARWLFSASLHAHEDKGHVDLKGDYQGPEDIEVIDFFPAKDVPLEFSKPTIFKREFGKFTLHLNESDLTVESPRLTGLVVFRGAGSASPQSVEVDLPWPGSESEGFWGRMLAPLIAILIIYGVTRRRKARQNKS